MKVEILRRQLVGIVADMESTMSRADARATTIASMQQTLQNALRIRGEIAETEAKASMARGAVIPREAMNALAYVTGSLVRWASDAVAAADELEENKDPEAAQVRNLALQICALRDEVAARAHNIFSLVVVSDKTPEKAKAKPAGPTLPAPRPLPTVSLSDGEP